MADAADWYQFSMAGFGEPANFKSLVDRESGHNLDLELYDLYGTQVAAATSAGWGIIRLEGLLPGSYRIKVFAASGRGSADYSLTVVPGRDDQYEEHDTMG